MQDLFIILQWWFVFFSIGIIFLPFTAQIFASFHDKGYIFSKIVGIAIISYLVFILSTIRIIPFSLLSTLSTIFILIALNIFILIRFRVLSQIQTSWKIILLEEILFFLALLFWAYIRAHEPSIHGLEKFMDFGFINSILRSEYLPPKDMWLAGETINYYYFGHFVTALLTRLSLLPSFITYNLMIATLFACTFSCSFSIALNLVKDLQLSKKIIFTGILSGFLVSLAGNLHTIYAFFLPYKGENPVPFWTLKFSLWTWKNGVLTFTFPNNYWYANATRFIPFTIHEFPLYSFVVSDLHGHVIDIPFVLLTIALLYSLFKSKKISTPFVLFLSLLIAIMYMTNAWDGIIYFLLAALVILCVNTKLLHKPALGRGIKHNLSSIMFNKSYILHNTYYIILVFAGFIIFSLPFSIHFKPFVSGIGVICAPDFLTRLQKVGPFLFEPNHCQRSPFYQLIILYGFFYFFVILFILSIIRKKITLLKQDFFVLLVIFLSTVLIIIPEFIYVKDIYPAHYRANTMFKLVYQSFIMLSLSSAYIIKRVGDITRKIIFLPFVIVLCTFILIYPYFAIESYYSIIPSGYSFCQNISYPNCVLKGITDYVKADSINYKGLDGTAWLKGQYPSDYEAILWINTHISGQPVLLEAQGDSYTDYARISANTGLPTVLGWTVHEWLWRGTYDIPAPRIDEVKTIYESTDIKKTVSLLKKYHVSYVYIGELEMQKYPMLYEEKFKSIGKVIYRNQKVKLYKLKV